MKGRTGTLDFGGQYRSPHPSGLPAFHRNPRGTEVVAALRAAQTAPTVTARLLDVLERAGERGLTYPEAREAIGKVSAQQRLSDLATNGTVVDSGRRRPTPNGVPATAWVLPKFRKGKMA